MCPRPILTLSHRSPRLIVPPSLNLTLTYNGMGAQWDGDTIGQGHNGTERDEDRETMRLGQSGTGTQ